MKTVTGFIFLGSKITSDGDCSHGIKRCLLLGRKAMTNLDSVLKSRDITLPTKIHIVKAMVFPVVMYGCESWTIRRWELDHREGWALKNQCFSTVVLEKTGESLGQQEDQTRHSWRKSTMNFHWKDWCWSSNTLAMWCKELTHWKRPWCWERLKTEGEEGNSGWDGWTASLIQQTWMWANSGKWWDVNREAWCAAVHGVTKSWTRLRSWTTTTTY